MRISDWSSDVCSSDLLHQPRSIRAIDGTVIEASGGAHDGCDLQGVADHIGAFFACADRHNHPLGPIDDRIELLDTELDHVGYLGRSAEQLFLLQPAILSTVAKRLYPSDIRLNNFIRRILVL